MGSPLSPIVANLFMEKFEREALNSYPLKPTRWKRYVDDTNVLWPHGETELRKFFEHLNNRSEDIKFTMEEEDNGSIPFLDVLVTRKVDGTLGHKVFRKKTHTESYLHADSHHHPSQKIGVLNTLAIRASRIFDSEHLKDENNHLTNIFKSIGYKSKDIKNVLKRTMIKTNMQTTRTNSDKTENINNSQKPIKRAYLPYIKGVTDKIAKILKKKDITTSFKTVQTIKQRMRPIKDPIDHKQGKGVYKISCSCELCYIGETGRSFNTRLKEHKADIRNERTRTSALAEHSQKTRHQLCLENTQILAKENHYFKRKLREALEIRKHPNNLNRDGGMEISTSWLPPLLNHNRRH